MGSFVGISLPYRSSAPWLAMTALMLLLAAITGCTSSGTEDQGQQADQAMVESIPTHEQLANATYSGIYDDPVTLTDGLYEGEPYVEGASARPRVQLIDGMSATGDLDGGGVEEIVVLVTEMSGGTGENLYLAVMRGENGAAMNVGTALVGDRIKLRSMAIIDNRLQLEVLQAGPEDAMCCPGELATREWAFTDAGFEEVSTEVTGRLSLAALVGPEWVLTGLDFREAAPAEPKITMTVAEDGSVSGSSGCNSFNGKFEQGAELGSLSSGPFMSTMMACEPETMELEQLFLKRLGGVTGFSFWVGHLSLAWQDADGGGTLMFEPRNPDP
jgi:heat shock protein HslJ